MFGRISTPNRNGTRAKNSFELQNKFGGVVQLKAPVSKIDQLRSRHGLLPHLVHHKRNTVGSVRHDHQRCNRVGMKDDDPGTHQWHRGLYSEEPSPDQRRLYRLVTEMRGFSDRALSEARFDAVLVLGLLLGPMEERVVILSPEVHAAWILARIDKVFRALLEKTKLEGGDVVERIGQFKKLFSRFCMTGKVLRLETEPQHWVSFGFDSNDPLPEWMPERLLRDDDHSASS